VNLVLTKDFSPLNSCVTCGEGKLSRLTTSISCSNTVTADYGSIIVPLSLSILLSALFLIGVFFLIPKALRTHHLSYRLPLVAGLAQLLLSLLPLFIHELHGRHSLYTWTLMFLNAPAIAVVSLLPASSRFSPNSGSVLGEGVFVALCVVTWMLISCVVGLIIDKRRRRTKGILDKSSTT
jgi:hypothetical protein